MVQLASQLVVAAEIVDQDHLLEDPRIAGAQRTVDGAQQHRIRFVVEDDDNAGRGQCVQIVRECGAQWTAHVGERAIVGERLAELLVERYFGELLVANVLGGAGEQDGFAVVAQAMPLFGQSGNNAALVQRRIGRCRQVVGRWRVKRMVGEMARRWPIWIGLLHVLEQYEDAHEKSGREQDFWRTTAPFVPQHGGYGGWNGIWTERMCVEEFLANWADGSNSSRSTYKHYDYD